MKKITVLHYINQFFAQIGGEDQADHPVEFFEGEEIEIICDGADEKETMAALEALITSGFEEVLTNE